MTVLKKALVLLVGGGLLLVGLAMVVLPGPAFVVIPAALAILAIEFVWARRCLTWLRERLKAVIPIRSSSASARNLNSTLFEFARRPTTLWKKLSVYSKTNIFSRVRPVASSRRR